MDSVDAIKRDFLDGEEAVYAIERLEKIGYSSTDAEALVETWETE